MTDPEHSGLALDFALKDFVGHPVKVMDAEGMGRRWVLIEWEQDRTEGMLRREIER